MKFIRNVKTRERVVDFLAKSVLIAFSALVCLWMISGARAAGAEITDIKQSEMADGSYAVDFLLSKAVGKDQISVDFQRNFIQLTMNGVTAYPARTTKLSDARMEKVFTYQYQPDVTRARLLLKGQASAIQSASSWDVDAQRIRILVKGAGGSAAKASDSIKARAAAPLDPDEEKMRQELIAGKPAAPVAATSASASVPAMKPATDKVIDQESLPVFGNNAPAKEKESGNPISRMITSLVLVLGIVAAGGLAFKKFAKNQGIQMPFQRQNGKMIEVISTQGIGPKRSIAIVKVLDQYMVVGMSGDSMCLLSNLGTNPNVEKFMDENSSGASFNSTFAGVLSGGVTSKAPVATAGIDAVVPRSSGEQGVRSAIKKRIEGFKQL
jgi:flagellar biogenesis protein FliO